jgi:hypothetical protein
VDKVGSTSTAVDLGALASVVMQRFQNEPTKAGAVLLRLQALGRLIANGNVPSNWLPNEGDGQGYVSMMAAAAVQPLVVVDDQVTFEREEFLKKALELSKTQGTA